MPDLRMAAFVLCLIFFPLNLSAQKSSLKVVFGSCINEPQSSIWQSIQKESPDLLILMGDNIYLRPDDLKSDQAISEHYNRHFSTPALAKLIEAVKTEVIWDDHDFGLDNSDKNFKYAQRTRAAFFRQWPQARGSVFKDSVARVVEVRGVRIIFTDSRSFKTTEGERVCFGKEQLKWIEAELAKPGSRYNLLVSAIQVLNASGSHESLRECPDEQAELISILRQSFRPTVLLSGDTHYAEILKKDLEPQSVVEITSSPLSAPLKPTRMIGEESSRLELFAKDNNFGVLSIDLDGATPSMIAVIKDSSGRAVVGPYRFSGETLQ